MFALIGKTKSLALAASLAVAAEGPPCRGDIAQASPDRPVVSLEINYLDAKKSGGFSAGMHDVGGAKISTLGIPPSANEGRMAMRYTFSKDPITIEVAITNHGGGVCLLDCVITDPFELMIPEGARITHPSCYKLSTDQATVVVRESTRLIVSQVPPKRVPPE